MIQKINLDEISINKTDEGRYIMQRDLLKFNNDFYRRQDEEFKCFKRIKKYPRSRIRGVMWLCGVGCAMTYAISTMMKSIQEGFYPVFDGLINWGDISNFHITDRTTEANKFYYMTDEYIAKEVTLCGRRLKWFVWYSFVIKFLITPKIKMGKVSHLCLYYRSGDKYKEADKVEDEIIIDRVMWKLNGEKMLLLSDNTNFNDKLLSQYNNTEIVGPSHLNGFTFDKFNNLDKQKHLDDVLRGSQRCALSNTIFGTASSNLYHVIISMKLIFTDINVNSFDERSIHRKFSLLA